MKGTEIPKQSTSLTLKILDSTDIKALCQIAIEVTKCSQFLYLSAGGWPWGRSPQATAEDSSAVIAE